MIIDIIIVYPIIVIFKFYLFVYSIHNMGIRIRYRYLHVRIRTPCFIIRTPYIPLDKLYIIDKPISLITITLFIINFMNNLI